MIKTREFDKKLNHDIMELSVNRNVPLQLKGSYSIKNFGDIISDIDYTSHVSFNSTLLEVLYTKISKLKNFMFVRLTCGYKNHMSAPWNIEKDYFNYNEGLLWIQNLKNKLPKDVYNQVYDIYTQSSLTIKDLIVIEDIIQPFSELVWNEFDIKKGFLVVNNQRYNLLEQMMHHEAVLEFIYVYNQGEDDVKHYVNIDVGLVDKKVNIPQPRMRKFYENDSYQMFKSLRWKIKNQYRPDYLHVAKKIEELVYYKNTILMIEKMRKYKLISTQDIEKIDVPRGLTIGKIDQLIDEIIHKDVNFVDYALHKLEDKYTREFVIKLGKSAESQVRTPINYLRFPENALFLSTWFLEITDEQILKIFSVYDNLLLDPMRLIYCMKTITYQDSIDFSSIYNQFNFKGRYTLKIDTQSSERVVNVYDTGKLIVSRPLSEMNTVQMTLLVI